MGGGGGALFPVDNKYDPGNKSTKRVGKRIERVEKGRGPPPTPQEQMGELRGPNNSSPVSEAKQDAVTRFAQTSLFKRERRKDRNN